MNQILSPFSENNKQPEIKNNFNKKKHSFFKIQFWISTGIAVISLILYLFVSNALKEEERIAQKLVDNFNISTLYQNNTNYDSQKLAGTIRNYQTGNSHFSVIGLIEIPNISIIYPIISHMNDELLKISPCRFYGPDPNEIGNMCIAGHNYDNYKFFSKIKDLQQGDTFLVYDTSGNNITYEIYKKYETQSDDTTCTNQETNGKREVTLVTCNNISGNRIIVKARER